MYILSNNMPRKLNRVQQKQVKDLALSVVKKQSETKNSSFPEENIQLYHHTPHFHSNMLYTQPGDNSGDRAGTWTIREGDELYLQHLRLKFWLSNKQDRPNVIYRILVFWYNSEQAGVMTANHVLNAMNNMLLNEPNRENISVIADEYVRNVGDSQSGREHSTLKFINKSWKNKKIVYNDTDTPTAYQPKKRDIGYMVLAYDAYGTLISDNIASMAVQYDIKYKEN